MFLRPVKGNGTLGSTHFNSPSIIFALWSDRDLHLVRSESRPCLLQCCEVEKPTLTATWLALLQKSPKVTPTKISTNVGGEGPNLDLFDAFSILAQLLFSTALQAFLLCFQCFKALQHLLVFNSTVQLRLCAVFFKSFCCKSLVGPNCDLQFSRWFQSSQPTFSNSDQSRSFFIHASSLF